jgi:hypothetical protein
MLEFHTVRLFVAISHEYNLAIEYWRKFAEARVLENEQLQQRIGILQTQLEEGSASHELQKQMIFNQRKTTDSLEEELGHQTSYSAGYPILPSFSPSDPTQLS